MGGDPVASYSLWRSANPRLWGSAGGYVTVQCAASSHLCADRAQIARMALWQHAWCTGPGRNPGSNSIKVLWGTAHSSGHGAIKHFPGACALGMAWYLPGFSGVLAQQGAEPSRPRHPHSLKRFHRSVCRGICSTVGHKENPMVVNSAPRQPAQRAGPWAGRLVRALASVVTRVRVR